MIPYTLTTRCKLAKLFTIGRKEIITFFYIYLALTLFSLLIDAGVVPPGSGPFPYFVAVQNGLISALCTCLLVNGFVGFQLYEDGTALSVWLIRVPSAAMFALSFVISLATFKSWGSMGPQNTTGLFVVLYLLNAISIAVYLAMQFLLVSNTLDDRWPLGHISFGVLVFIIGQVLLYQFSDVICNNVQHYLDGLFFATFCNLLAVMMIYKVSSCFMFVPLGLANISFSFGTQLPRRIWNSQSVSSQTLGRSRNRYPRKSAELRSTPTITPSMRAACTTTALPRTVIIIIDHVSSFFSPHFFNSSAVYVTIDFMISCLSPFHGYSNSSTILAR